jgi:DNA-binding transcriptional regulator YdaS (Cro superfamily)
VSARRVAAAALLLATLAFASPLLAAAAATIVDLPAKLAPEIARAKTGRVAVLIPSSIHADVAASHLYGSGGATANGYDIQLAYAPGCNDGTACFFAEFQGGPQPLLVGTRVALAHAITGTFSPIRCGASCGPAAVQWRERGVLYSVQYVLGGRAKLTALADSAIDAGAR